MGAIASQITSLTIVYSTVYSCADQSKHQSSASMAFVWGIHRGPVNSPHKWPVKRKMFPFDDVIMNSWKFNYVRPRPVPVWFNHKRNAFFSMVHQFLCGTNGISSGLDYGTHRPNIKTSIHRKWQKTCIIFCHWVFGSLCDWLKNTHGHLQ